MRGGELVLALVVSKTDLSTRSQRMTFTVNHMKVTAGGHKE